MAGKRIKIHDQDLLELKNLGDDRMMTLQELMDEAIRDLLRKHGRPATLKEALRKSAQSAKRKQKG